MAAVENFLQFQQETTTPCQVRAKRGFATHPRSIAERVKFLGFGIIVSPIQTEELLRITASLAMICRIDEHGLVRT